ncbi:DUF2442 domain-containing protein [Fibrella aquatilis]|nr:DUF2442 domain-containing protein [Fibrella aquatilis]
MSISSMPGSKPLVSNRLQDLLEAEESEPVSIMKDEFDQLIDREQLRIIKVLWVRELDLFLFVLSNRRIITQPLSLFPTLQLASDEQLSDYIITATGVHWPGLDADLSLRGLLMQEVVKPTAIIF